MASSDRRAARTAAFGVVLVAITAAVISFTHVRTVATRAGESELTSWLLPVSIDGAVVAAVSVLLADSRAGRRPRALTWLLLALGLAASLAANVASAEPTAIARAVAAWPPLALALGIEVLAGLARRSESQHAGPSAMFQPWLPRGLEVSDGNGRAAAHNGERAAGISGMLPDGQSANGNGRAGERQQVLDDDVAIGMIRELDASSNGPVSRLEIQKALGCGGSRAARLADLARQRVGERTA
jgi:hypothetical protein